MCNCFQTIVGCDSDLQTAESRAGRPLALNSSLRQCLGVILYSLQTQDNIQMLLLLRLNANLVYGRHLSPWSWSVCLMLQMRGSQLLPCWPAGRLLSAGRPGPAGCRCEARESTKAPPPVVPDNERNHHCTGSLQSPLWMNTSRKWAKPLLSISSIWMHFGQALLHF